MLLLSAVLMIVPFIALAGIVMLGGLALYSVALELQGWYRERPRVSLVRGHGIEPSLNA